MKYRATTGCFYLDGQPAPAGAIDATEDEFQAALSRGVYDSLAVVDGHVVVVPESDASKLTRAKVAKAEEIETAFQAAEATPITVNGWQFKGGFTSGLAIDAQRRAAEMYRQLNPQAPDTATFFDVHGTPVTVPLLSDAEVDAADICLSISYVVSLNTFKYEQLRNAVWAAITAEEVAAISWSD